MVRIKKTPLLGLFLTGAVLPILGAMMKTTHLPIASPPLVVGMVFEACAAFLLIWKLFGKYKSGSFRDS